METKKAFAVAKTSMADAGAIRSDVAQMLRDLAGAVVAGTSLKAIWRALATRLRLTVGQVTRLWYENWVAIPAHIYLTVKLAWDRRNFLEQAVENQAARFVERRQRMEMRRACDR